MKIKYTADTITNEQIRAAFDDDVITFDVYYRAVHRTRLVGESQSAYDRSRAYYRERCEEILNAKEGKSC